MNYALVSNTVVVNIIIWDGKSPYEPPAGEVLVEITNPEVSIGWFYIDGQFVAPPEPAPDTPQDKAQPTVQGAQTL